MYVCMYMCKTMYICMYVCMYVCMFVCIFLCWIQTIRTLDIVEKSVCNQDRTTNFFSVNLWIKIKEFSLAWVVQTLTYSPGDLHHSSLTRRHYVCNYGQGQAGIDYICMCALCGMDYLNPYAALG